MPSAGVDVIALLAALLCLRAPVRTQAIVLIGALFLVPDAVHPTVGVAESILRLVLWSTTIGLVLHARRGTIPRSSLRPGRVHVGLGLFVALAYVVGVSWAPWPANFSIGFHSWLTLVDQLLFLWCVTVITRTQGVRWVATTVVAVVTMDAGIGIVERLTGGSYSHWWYLHQGQQALATVGGPLERRGGVGSTVRVRANAEFSLQYGWVLAMIAPLACAIALDRPHRPRRGTGPGAEAPLTVGSVAAHDSEMAAGSVAAGRTVATHASEAASRTVAAGGPAAAHQSEAAAGTVATHGSAAGLWRRVSPWWIAPVLIAVAMVLTVSRSLFVGLGVAAVAWVIFSRFDRRVVAFVGVIALGAAALLVAVPSLRHPYHQAFADSVDSRVRRQQVVAAAVVPRPLTGVGFSGLATYGISGTDSYYVYTYGTLGVAGLVTLIGALVSSLAVAADGALRSRSVLPGAAAAGIAAGLIAAGAFDSLSGATSAWPLWLLVGIAAVAYEHAGPRATPSLARVAAPLVGLAVGVVAWAVVHPRATTFSTFEAIDARYLAPNIGDPSYAGSVAANTICNDGKAALQDMPVKVVCGSRPGPGVGYVQVSGANAGQVDTALTAFDRVATTVSTPYHRAVITRFHTKSTPARTAPAWLGGGGLVLAVLLPSRRVKSG